MSYWSFCTSNSFFRSYLLVSEVIIRLLLFGFTYIHVILSHMDIKFTPCCASMWGFFVGKMLLNIVTLNCATSSSA